MKYEIHGIVMQIDKNKEIARDILLKDDQGNYKKISLSLDKPFTRNLVISTVSGVLKIEPDEVSWPANIVIPESWLES